MPVVFLLLEGSFKLSGFKLADPFPPLLHLLVLLMDDEDVGDGDDTYELHLDCVHLLTCIICSYSDRSSGINVIFCKFVFLPNSTSIST